MARKKADSSEKKKKAKKKASKSKSTKKAKKSAQTSVDPSIVIVDDDLEIDKEKILEERRLYLEEARSQEASD